MANRVITEDHELKSCGKLIWDALYSDAKRVLDFDGKIDPDAKVQVFLSHTPENLSFNLNYKDKLDWVDISDFFTLLLLPNYECLSQIDSSVQQNYSLTCLITETRHGYNTYLKIGDTWVSLHEGDLTQFQSVQDMYFSVATTGRLITATYQVNNSSRYSDDMVDMECFDQIL